MQVNLGIVASCLGFRLFSTFVEPRREETRFEMSLKGD